MHDRPFHFCGRTRREFLWQAGGGFAGVALANLLGDAWIAGQAHAAHGLSPNLAADLHRPFLTHAPKARSVIFLFMYGCLLYTSPSPRD